MLPPIATPRARRPSRRTFSLRCTSRMATLSPGMWVLTARRSRPQPGGCGWSTFSAGLWRTPWPTDMSFCSAHIRLRVGRRFRSGRRRPRVGPGGWPWSGLALVRATANTRRTRALLCLPFGLPVRRTLGLTVARSEGNFKLDDFIPLLVGAITLRDGEKFAEPATRIQGGRVVHGDIMTHTMGVVQQP